MINDLLPLLKRIERDKIERQEVKQAFVDVGVFVLLFIMGLVIAIIL